MKLNLTKSLVAAVTAACCITLSAQAGTVFSYNAEYTNSPTLSTDAASLNGADGQIGTWSGTIPQNNGGHSPAGTSFLLDPDPATGSGNLLLVDRPESEPAIMTANLVSPVETSVGGAVSFTVGSRRTQSGSDAKDYDIIGLDASDQESFHLRISAHNSKSRLSVIDNGLQVLDLVSTYGGTGTDAVNDLDNTGRPPNVNFLKNITVTLGATGYTVTMRRSDNGTEIYTTGEILYNGAATAVSKMDFVFSGGGTSVSSGAFFDDIEVEAFEGIISETSAKTTILGSEQLNLEWTIPAATGTTTYEIESDNLAVFDPSSDIVSQSGDGTTMGTATLNAVGTLGGGLTVTVNAVDGGSTIASVNISFSTPVPVLSADRTVVFLGEVVTFSWVNAIDHDTLILSNDANGETINLAPLTNPTTGAGSVTTGVVDATYTVTGTRIGSGDETSDVVITVQSAPDLAAAVIPSITDGTVPVDICWEATAFNTGFANTLTGFSGTTATDANTDFDLFLDGNQDNLSIVLTNSILQPDTPIDVTASSGNDLTLASSPLDNLTHAETGVIREYEAYNEAAQIASGLDNTRWADANNPGNVGTNGAAYMRGTASPRVLANRDPVDVSDPSVPVITKAYLSGPSLGYASVWEGGLMDTEAASDHAIEVWFQPNTLMGGGQIILEYGGNGNGSYLAMADTDSDGLDDNVVFQVAGASYQTIPASIDPQITLGYDIDPTVVASGTFESEDSSTPPTVLTDDEADFSTLDSEKLYLVTLTSGLSSGETTEVISGAGTILGVRGAGFGGNAAGATYEIQEATVPWTQILVRLFVTNNSQPDDSMILYVDGEEFDRIENVDINDAAGTDGGGIGGQTGTVALGGPIPDVPEASATNFFDGRIAIVRAYNSALSEGIVAANYLAITGDTPTAQQIADMDDQIETSAYALEWTVKPDQIVINDGVSDIHTSTDATGCFTTPSAVTTDTTYTVTATFAGSTGSSQRMVSVDTTGDGSSYEETILADGPVAYYRFEEEVDSPTIFDYSGNGFNSTSYSGTPVLGMPGIVQNSLVVAGDTGIDLPLIFDPRDPDGDGSALDGVDPDGIEAFSIEAMVRVDAPNPGQHRLVQQLDFNGVGRSLLYLSPTNHPRTYLGGADKNAEIPVFTESWCHLVLTVTYDDILSAHVLRFYVNGQLANDPLDPAFAVITESSEGAWRLAADKPLGTFLDGSLDEVAIYDYGLDDPNGDGDQSDSVVEDHLFAMTANTEIVFLSLGPLDDQGTNEGVIGPSGTATAEIMVGPDAMSVTVNGVAVTPVNGIASVALSGLVIGDNLVTVNVDGDERTITVTLLGEVTITDWEFDPNGISTLTAVNGVPGVEYDLESSENLLDWTFATPVTAPASTILNATDSIGAQGAPRFFYHFTEYIPIP